MDEESHHVYVIELKKGSNTYSVDKDTIIGTGCVLHRITGEVAEMCRTAIRPRYREIQQGIHTPFNDLVTVLLADIQRVNANKVCAHTFTTHAKSQSILDNRKRDFTPAVFERQKLHEVFDNGREGGVFYIHIRERRSSEPPSLQPSEHEGLENTAEHILTSLGMKRRTASKKGQTDLISLNSYELSSEAEHRIFQITPGNDLEVSDAVSHIESMSNKLPYVEVQAAANDPSSVTVIDSIMEGGFDAAGFLPEWLRSDSIAYDAYIAQSSPSGTRTIQITQRVKEFIEALNITEDLDERLTPHEDVKGVYLLEI